MNSPRVMWEDRKVLTRYVSSLLSVSGPSGVLEYHRVSLLWKVSESFPQVNLSAAVVDLARAVKIMLFTSE